MREELQGLRGFLAAAFHDVAEGHDEHRVAREHRRVFVPFAVYCRAAASHIGVIHEVVVQQRVVVVGLQTDGCGHGAVEVFAVDAVGQQEKGGAQALSAFLKNILDGFVKTFGF